MTPTSSRLREALAFNEVGDPRPVEALVILAKEISRLAPIHEKLIAVVEAAEAVPDADHGELREALEALNAEVGEE